MTRPLALALLVSCAPARPPLPEVPDMDALEARILWGRERVEHWQSMAFPRFERRSPQAKGRRP